MSTQITLGDILDNVNDLTQNYDVTSIDRNNKIRQVNRAIEYIKRRLSLQSDKKIYSFYFYEDVKFYDLEDGFDELLKLYYNTSSIEDSDKNIPRYEWNGAKDLELLSDTGMVSNKNKVAFTTINGKNQLMLVGANLRGRNLINSFDTLTGLTFSADVSNQTADTYVKKQGSASVKFDIDTSLSSTSISFPGNWDIREYINISSAYRTYIKFPTGTTGYFTNVKLRLQSSTGNYYEMTTTTQQDGTAWIDTDWSFLSFSLANATTTGSPDASAINQIELIFTHSGTFAAVTNIRVDYLYMVNPDYMDCVYLTAVKGTDNTGNTDKIFLTVDTDILSFGPYAADLITPIALKAALFLWPQLRGDTNFWQIYKADCEDTINIWGKVYPRDRMTGIFGSTQIKR